MWSFVLNLITSSVASAFGWLQQIFNAAPGAWDSIFTLFVILAICRFLLGPILGVAFGVAGSDKSKKAKGKDSNNNGKSKGG